MCISFYFSLLKPHKYSVRRLKKEQSISTISRDRDQNRHLGGSGPARLHGGPHGPGDTGRNGTPQELYEMERHTQVKTYLDQGNGYSQRSGGSTLYSKVGVSYSISSIYAFLCQSFPLNHVNFVSFGFIHTL